MPDAALVSHCLELLAPLGATRSRRMFGGHALYVDELCIALVLRDTLYLKVDDTHRAAFEAAGCRPFTYTDQHEATHQLSYYTAPEAAMESPHEMQPWGRRALAAAVAARAKAPPRPPRPPRASGPTARAAPRAGPAAKAPAKRPNRRAPTR